MLLDTSKPAPIGGVQEPTIMECPRCKVMVIIPANLMLRIPNTPNGNFCHVTIDQQGKEYRRG